jgi:hypothetical protein
MISKLKCYWFGYGGSSWMVERIRYIVEDELGMTLTTIHEHPNANISWSIDTVYKELENADIILVPANYRRQPCKSNNRVTQAMALAKPVICEPMPAYKDIINNLENGIILESDSLDEWRFALKLLRDDLNLRVKLANNALETSKLYSIKKMAKRWVNILNNIVDKKSEKSIDVVIPTKNNIPIIKECLKSFSQSTLEETVYIIDNDCESNNLENLIKELNLPYEIKEI